MGRPQNRTQGFRSNYSILGCPSANLGRDFHGAGSNRVARAKAPSANRLAAPQLEESNWPSRTGRSGPPIKEFGVRRLVMELPRVRPSAAAFSRPFRLLRST